MGATNTEIGDVLFSGRTQDSANKLSLVKDQKKSAEHMRSEGFLHLGAAAQERYQVSSSYVHE